MSSPRTFRGARRFRLGDGSSYSHCRSCLRFDMPVKSEWFAEIHDRWPFDGRNGRPDLYGAYPEKVSRLVVLDGVTNFPCKKGGGGGGEAC